MSVYFDKARELGKLILSSEMSLRLADADAALQSNETAKIKMSKLHDMQAEIQERLSRGSITQEEFDRVHVRISELASEIKRDPIISAAIRAENEYSVFVNQIFNILKATIGGVTDITDSFSCEKVKKCRGCH